MLCSCTITAYITQDHIGAMSNGDAGSRKRKCLHTWRISSSQISDGPCSSCTVGRVKRALLQQPTTAYKNEHKHSRLISLCFNVNVLCCIVSNACAGKPCTRMPSSLLSRAPALLHQHPTRGAIPLTSRDEIHPINTDIVACVFMKCKFGRQHRGFLVLLKL